MRDYQMEHWVKEGYVGNGIYIKSRGLYFDIMEGDNIHPKNIISLDEKTFLDILEFVRNHSSWLDQE